MHNLNPWRANKRQNYFYRFWRVYKIFYEIVFFYSSWKMLLSANVFWHKGYIYQVWSQYHYSIKSCRLYFFVKEFCLNMERATSHQLLQVLVQRNQDLLEDEKQLQCMLIMKYAVNYTNNLFMTTMTDIVITFLTS